MPDPAVRRAQLIAASVSLAIVAFTSCPSASLGSNLLAGGANEYRTRQLMAMIHWHRSLEAAKAEARKENKLIFWMHLLGSVDGFA